MTDICDSTDDNPDISTPLFIETPTGIRLEIITLITPPSRTAELTTAPCLSGNNRTKDAAISIDDKMFEKSGIQISPEVRGLLLTI